MKKLFVVVCAIFAASIINAAEAPSAWQTDLPKALEKAKEQGKQVLLDFTGSDWCPACKRLQVKVFDTKEFLDYAKTHFVLVEVDDPADASKITPQQKKDNDALADKFHIEGRPTIIILNASGKEVHRELGYDGEPVADYVKRLSMTAGKNTSESSKQ